MATTDWKLTRTLPSTSGDVRWDRLGQPGRPPVVLLHGAPITGAGHLVREDAPAELTAALVAFLQQPP